jgi:quercetin dioxygenase-like cupin family protein
MNSNRTIVNPLVGDRVTFLETAEETGGAHTLVEVELTADAKGTPLHYHTIITETFTVVNGELGLQLAKKPLLLKKGETASVPPQMNHRFYNPSGKPVAFQVRLSPGSPEKYA